VLQESATPTGEIYNTLNTTTMFLDTLLARLAPYECLGCSAEGALLCAACRDDLPHIPSRCYRCHKLSDDNKTCVSCRHTTDLYAVYAVTPYRGVAKELLWRLKFKGAQAATAEIAALMLPKLPVEPSMLFVPVPTATSRVRRRGYDQAVLLARSLAKRTCLPYCAALRREGQHEQVGSSRAQRLQQLQNAFYSPRPREMRGAHVVLVDDVVTTGATLEAAARIAKAAGAARISAVVFAQA